MAYTAMRAVVSTAILGLLVGCGGGGSQEKVVARAGAIEVTLADFHEAYNKITPNYRPDVSSLESRRSFANDLLNKEILLDEARRMGGITDPAILDALEKNKENKMLQILYRNEIEAKVEVLGRDVADLYDRRKVNVRASHILLEDVESARKLRDEIASGRISFEEAAQRHSLDQGTRRDGGSLGEIIWGRTIPSFQKVAFELEPGVVSEPVESEFGVHLIRVEERIPQERPSLEEMRPSLRADARRQMEGERMREFVRTLEEKAGLTWHEESLDLLLELIEAETRQDIDTIPEADRYIPHASPEQLVTALVTFSGRDWTIGDYVDYLRSQPPNLRPVTRLPRAGLREFIRNTQIQNQLLVEEAYARGLDKDPDIQAEAARLVESILIEQIHARFIQAADVPEEDVRAVYDSTYTANRDALMLPERVDLAILVHTDSAMVAKGLARIRSGEPEEAVVRELTLDLRTKEKGGRTGLIARGNYAPQIEEVAFSRAPGLGWTDPIVTESGTGALRVIAREEPRLATFEEVRDGLTQNLANGRGEAAFEKWLLEQRDARGVEIYDEVLELIGQSVS